MASREADASPKARWSEWGMAGSSNRNAPRAGGGAVYGLGMIGALIYFCGRAESGTDYLVAFLKASVWPAFLVYRAFRRLEQ